MGFAYLELSGVIISSSVALIHEAKPNLTKQDVDDLTNVKLVKLKQILKTPSLFRGEPADVVEKLSGLVHVPVVSGKVISSEVKASCAEKGVHLLESDGSGYRCLLHHAHALPPAPLPLAS